MQIDKHDQARIIPATESINYGASTAHLLRAEENTMTAPAEHPDERTPRDAGFSLLELMVVVVILSVLALVIVPRVIDRPD